MIRSAVRSGLVLIVFVSLMGSPAEAAGEPCGAGAGNTCAADEFCKLPLGDCGTGIAGVCTLRPQECPAIFIPVCGCDGLTYGNECESDQAGTSIAWSGSCDQTCGGLSGNSCDPDRYCKIPPGSCDVQDVVGDCVDLPTACPEIYDPVCGCDGVTYDNECFADTAGAQVDHPGECVQVCGGIAGIPCDAGEFCEFPEDTCDIADNQGICLPIPLACPDVTQPVCGCDGQTYRNECEAVLAGAQVAHQGECPRVCGGTSGITCDAGTFCKLPDGECNTTDVEGICTPMPGTCLTNYNPVCGCDGVTYSNLCVANGAGAQVDYPGECICGGIAGVPCNEGYYCKFPEGTCDIADNQGVCRLIPDQCSDALYPVCGCDGQTYTNECVAAAAGVSIEHLGECVQVCGGIAGIPCDDGEFCKLPAGRCNVADLQGVCAPQPEACPLFFDPVCGCDGETYGNECEADLAGAQIDHPGECDRVCGGIAGIPCEDGEYCQFPDDTCDIVDNLGVCRPIPQGCPDVWDPVCGCDGQTYGNRCEAATVGAQVEHEGECRPEICDGIAGIVCENSDDFCLHPDGDCLTSDASGICVPVPQACPEIFDPVCGCDGRTYGNRCEALVAGVQIDHAGECLPQVCGGIAGTPCDEGEFCKLPAGQCDVTDLQGVCQPIPDACALVFDPVCGCDGVTYGNQCEADRAGAQIDHPGECDRVCGGIAGIPCEDGEYCQFPDDTCDIVDNLGVCRPIPQGCPDVWDPVCGCDGQTYGNRCEAATVGAQVEHEGECRPEICDGIAGIVCENSDDFCLHPDGDCLTSDASGICVPVPQACPEIFDPVCGCDGRTYGNRCEALVAGVQIDHAGECLPQVCGGIAGTPCDEGEFCKLPAGQCDVTDLRGVCQAIPDACPLFFDPVCGCDGVTYGNECEADRAGAQLDHPGQCERACGGIAGEPCDEDEYCMFPQGTCDIADNQGVCRPIPQVCPDVWDPVCGCDGVTYGNRCEAAAKGISVDFEGECIQVCGGIAGVTCDEGEFCKFPEGECDTADLAGICLPIPVACPLFYDPVCGCDGVTYNNECDADQAGAQIDHQGECERVCGGIAGIPCDDGEFCKLPAGLCDTTDLQGVCTPIPLACPLFFDPVCGCDGVTYDNECDADRAGAQIDHPGVCEQSCGGLVGLSCDEGEYCVFPDGTCDIQDLEGVCRPIPDACPDVWDPVCGCDGVTYGNRCEAAAAEAQIASEGECGQTCGGFVGLPCDEGEYCMYPIGTCNFADHFGTCVPIPDSCSEICHPVCGCDGVTYGNLCLAQQAQISLDHRGECDATGRLIQRVRFDSQERMRWQPAVDALSYNVYIEEHETPPPADAGECYASGIVAAGLIIDPIPGEGQVWLIQVTGVFVEGEGPMGMSTDCTFRAPETTCDQQ